jgi:hypothetical protein
VLSLCVPERLLALVLGIVLLQPDHLARDALTPLRGSSPYGVSIDGSEPCARTESRYPRKYARFPPPATRPMLTPLR